MTAREKLQKEHPDWDDERVTKKIKYDCPHSYKYIDPPKYCVGENAKLCRDCWNREIPELTEVELENIASQMTRDNLDGYMRQMRKDLEEGRISVNEYRYKMGLPPVEDSTPRILGSGKKRIFIVNGMARSGKDTFAKFLSELVPTFKYSSIDKVKTIATQCGWNGGKTEKDRKFLSDLKCLTSEYSDMPFNDISDAVTLFLHSDEQVMLIDIREPAEIEKAKRAFNAKTILIKNDNVEQITSNMADAGVYDYDYDYVIFNNGTLEKFKSEVVQFAHAVIGKKDMSANEYQKAAMRTANPECICLSNVGLGLGGEAGECADLIKKHLHHGHDLDKSKLMKELGDVLWYVALGCEALGVDMGTVMQMNIDKLYERYPDGFDSEHSINRKEEDHEEAINMLKDELCKQFQIPKKILFGEDNCKPMEEPV